MRIREQLRPYIMEQYQKAAETGAPIMRPLFYDFDGDAAAAAVDDQLMFGPDYLVAPGVASRRLRPHTLRFPRLSAAFRPQPLLTFRLASVLVEDATERAVYLPALPAPYVWQNYFSGEVRRSFEHHPHRMGDTAWTTGYLFGRQGT